jgi:hypothetical protein
MIINITQRKGSRRLDGRRSAMMAIPAPAASKPPRLKMPDTVKPMNHVGQSNEAGIRDLAGRVA